MKTTLICKRVDTAELTTRRFRISSFRTLENLQTEIHFATVIHFGVKNRKKKKKCIGRRDEIVEQTARGSSGIKVANVWQDYSAPFADVRFGRSRIPIRFSSERAHYAKKGKQLIARRRHWLFYRVHAALGFHRTWPRLLFIPTEN